jgi:DNA modification methylase
MAKASKEDKASPAQAAAKRPARAELIWEGKYDAQGRRVAPLRVALPFQTVETANESTQERQKGFQFGAGFREDEWRNRLIWGDKKYVLPSLLPEFAGKVNLIYIDPPFDTGADFSFTATVPDHPDSEEEELFSFTKEPSIIEQKAYRDTWGGAETHLDAYLKWFYETATILHELLHETGTLYVHCNQEMASYLRCILDEIFGSENHMNDVIWHFENKPKFSFSKVLPRDWECILVYARQLGSQKFSHQLVPVKEVQQQAVVAWDPKLKKRIAKRDDKGQIIYETRTEKLMGSCWTIPIVHPVGHERTGYPTQKPEPLLERIIKISSDPEDLVLDCFCGSGTTATVAEKFERRWIACDLGRFAIHTTRKRLLSITELRPFVVQNLGKYERQAWAGSEFGDDQAAERQRAYIDFMLKLASATPLNGYTWLHGVKAGRMIHVGAVDAPVSVGDVTQIAAEFKRAIGTGKDAPKTNGVDVLGWDFAFEMNEVAKQQAAAANIQMRFLRIPRDVMDKRAVEQGDIHFFELAALSVDVKTSKRNVILKLKDFVIPPDDVPEDARKAVKHWSQWIDYWAVDWDNRSDTFHNEWQTYRTRKDKTLLLETSHAYADPGDYTVVVKVIDILGNDTTKTVKVTVK